MRQTRFIPRKNFAKAQEEVEKLLNQVSFTKSIKEIRNSLKGKKEDEDYEEILETGINDLIPLYNLHAGWRSFLREYILTDKYDTDFDPEAIEVTYGVDEYNAVDEEKRITLHLGRDIRREDLIHAWPQLRELIEINNKRLGTSKNFKRDKEFNSLKVKGKKAKEISAHFLDKKSGKPPTVEAIHKASQRFKNKKVEDKKIIQDK